MTRVHSVPLDLGDLVAQQARALDRSADAARRRGRRQTLAWEEGAPQDPEPLRRAHPAVPAHSKDRGGERRRRARLEVTVVVRLAPPALELVPNLRFDDAPRSALDELGGE